MRIVIIGGTAAGMSAAAKLRRVNKEAEVIVYEKRSYISFGACGLPYYVGDFFEEANEMIARTVEQAIEAGIDIRTQCEVVRVLESKKKVFGVNLQTKESFEIEYDTLMIATGASALVPPIDGRELKGVHYLHSLEDGIALKEHVKSSAIKKVAVIGAGFIGVELVEALKEYEKEIFLFQRGPRILARVFDGEITDILEAHIKEQGIQLYLGAKVEKILGKDKVEGVIVEGETIPMDAVVITAGIKPNTDFLEDTNIKRLDNGAIIVDDYGRTSVEHIYAAGDCATVPHKFFEEGSYIPLATTANKLGRVVGENMGGLNTVFQKTLGSSCIKVLDLEAGSTGLTQSQVQKMEIPYKVSFITDKNHTSYFKGQTPLWIKLIYHRDSKVILGGQIVGTSGAVHRVDVIAAAIFSEMTTDQLGQLDLCYSPPFARTWDALNIAGNASK